MINIRQLSSKKAIGAVTAAATVGAVSLLGVGTASAAAHPAAEVTAATVNAATVNDVSVAVKQIDNSSAGHSYVRLVYTNTSKHSVSIKGYSGISFVAYGNGTQVGKPAVWLHDHSAKTVTLTPGQHTGELVSIADPGVYGPVKHHSVTSDGFRVYLPGETRALFAPFKTLASTRNVAQLAAEPVGVTK